ncbi:glycosyltransferase family 4 protein [Adlercreutzia sp. ZJ304]|uniref:glycosyltransferase family 4 protein n=1 Tax=Adlercreutzia sp. ZJ304 TaxID=2709791 RepID=UPI0013E9E1FF|nr:glycosyltransferase family 4 protein [Adlercreutzia sp. ZJ304]
MTDKYYPRPFANAVCAQNVARSFVEAGHEADVIAFDDPFESLPSELDDVRVHGVRPDERLKLFYLASDLPSDKKAKAAMAVFRSLNFVSRLSNWTRYPLASKALAQRIANLAISLHRAKPYDCLVATCCPVECIEAAVRVRACLPDIPLFAYCVDYIPNTLRRHISEKKQASASEYWVNRIGHNFDYVIGMAFEEGWYRSSYAAASRARVLIGDLPLLSDVFTATDYTTTVSGDWVYAGSLSRGHYNPVPAMETFSWLSAHGIVGSAIFHIVGRGDLARLCREWEVRTGGVIQFHDYMTHNDLERMYDNASVLVSMKCSDQISAKLFEYMAQEKPLLHFSEHSEDPDRQYVDRYRLGLTVDVLDGEPEVWGLQVAGWLSAIDGISLPPGWTSEFEKNRPSYTRDLILSHIHAGSCDF